MPFLNALKTQSVVFENFYTSVGIGVSSDAEIATLTGLYPSGISNLYWQDFNSIKKNIHTKLFLKRYLNISNRQNIKLVHFMVIMVRFIIVKTLMTKLLVLIRLLPLRTLRI